MESFTICFKPIGFVEEGIPRLGERTHAISRHQIVSTIRVYDEYAEGLRGLEEYSHIIIIYYMHEEKEVRLAIGQ